MSLFFLAVTQNCNVTLISPIAQRCSCCSRRAHEHSKCCRRAIARGAFLSALWFTDSRALKLLEMFFVLLLSVARCDLKHHDKIIILYIICHDFYLWHHTSYHHIFNYTIGSICFFVFNFSFSTETNRHHDIRDIMIRLSCHLISRKVPTNDQASDFRPISEPESTKQRKQWGMRNEEC